MQVNVYKRGDKTPKNRILYPVMIRTFRRPTVMERRLIYIDLGDRWDAGFGQTGRDNSIHRVNNNGLYDETTGLAARGIRRVGKIGNDVGAFVGNKPKRAAFPGIYGQTRADLLEVAMTPIDVLRDKNKIGRAINGVTSLFDVAYDAVLTDPATLVAGDHVNTPEKRVPRTTNEQIREVISN